MVDSGSVSTLIKISTLARLQDVGQITHVHVEQTHTNLYDVNGNSINILGKVRLNFNFNSVNFLHYVTVVGECDFPGDILLGTDLMRRIGNVTFNWQHKYVHIGTIQYPLNEICSKIEK